MVVQGYLFMQRAIAKLEAEFTMLQKLDVASVYLRRDLQSAGYRGPSSVYRRLAAIEHGAQDVQAFTDSQIAFAINNIADQIVDKKLQAIRQIAILAQLKPNAALLFIQDVPQAMYHLQAPITDPCASILVVPSKSLKAGAAIAIADNFAIERFVASSVIGGQEIYHQLPENSSQCLAFKHPQTAEVIELEQVVYYLAKVDKNGLYTLYRDNLRQPAAGIINGVEDFYVTEILQPRPQATATIAAQAGAHRQIKGVTIGLLLRANLKRCAKQRVSWRGLDTTFADAWCRRSLEFTVALRNVM